MRPKPCGNCWNAQGLSCFQRGVVPCCGQNRQLLKAAGTVLYLQASPETIYRRLRHDTQRPLLQVSDPMEKIRALFNERDALYRETAHHVVHSGRSPLPVLVQKIIKRLQPGNSL